MTKAKSFYKAKTFAVVLLGVLFACSLLFAVLLSPPAVHAEGTVRANTVFDTEGAEMAEGQEVLTYIAADGETVNFRRDMALKWYTLASAGIAGKVQYFSVEFSFAALSFTSFTLTMETTEMSMSKEGKAVNAVVFTPSEEGDALNVSVNGEEAGNLSYAAGDTLVVSFAGDDTCGNFDLRVENLNKGAAISGKQFTNIGKNYADFASASSDTPVTPLSFAVEAEPEETLTFSILSLNGQSFAFARDEEDALTENITDDTPPVLVVDSEIKQFVLGTEFDFVMIALDVCDSSIPTSDRVQYYYADPDEGKIVFTDGVLQVSETTGDGDDAVTADIYTEWESDHLFFEDEFGAAPRTVSVAVSLTDDSDNVGWYLLEWYGSYSGEYGIPVKEPEEDQNVRPSAGFYTWDENASNAPQADGTAAKYQSDVTAASVQQNEEGAETSIQVGVGAYFYLPSLKPYIKDATCGYTDMEFTIYYTVNNGATSSESGLSYDELSIEVDTEGTYRFRVVPSNAMGNASRGVFESADGYKYKDITTDNVWDALNLETFTFSVVYNGPSVEPSDSDDIGYVDATFTFDDFEIVAKSGHKETYTLYRVVLLEGGAEYLESNAAASVEQAYADGLIAASEDAVEDGDIGYLVAIAEYDSELDDDEGDNVYDWDPDSSLTFVPQEIGYYLLSVSVRSDPWSTAFGEVSAQKVVYVSAESDIRPGEGESVIDWLQNNVLSVVFLAVGAACLIAIIVLLLVRPKKKPAQQGAAESGEEPSLQEKRKQRKNK